MFKLRAAAGSNTNSFISLASEEPESGEGQLANTVAGIKDNIAVRGMRMTCASRVLENYVAPYDATVVERLRNGGAKILGKNNMDEFACGSSGENSAFGPVLNPGLPGRVPGGSSSGSAAAVSEGLVDFAIGSDTGGSVRCPASYCSVVGLKPTYGRVSRYGLADLSMSLESPAPLVPWGSGLLLARLMDCISGPDERDQTTENAKKTACVGQLECYDPAGSTVAVPENALASCVPEVRLAFDRSLKFLESHGATVEKVQMKTFDSALAAYYLIMYSEFASAMQRYDGLKYGTRGAGYTPAESVFNSRSLLGQEAKRRILLGTYITSLEGRSAWYVRALSAREAVSNEIRGLLESYDILAMPTMPSPPFGFGEKSDPLLMYATDILTVPANLAGIPAVSLPIGPGIGLQLAGERNSEEMLVSAVHYFEKEGWKW